MMRSNLKWLTGMLILLEVLVSVAESVKAHHNQFCLNADNVINKLYINGEDWTSKLPKAKWVKGCDCVTLPMNVRSISIKATNVKGVGGLQVCRTANVADYDGWRCVNADKVAGQAWYSPSYSIRKWKPARNHLYRHKRSCKKWRKLPCKTSFRKWFWAVTQVPRVACRIDYCAEACYGCQVTGPGHCDRDKCIWGPGTYDNETLVLDDGYVRCKRKCCLEVKATGKTEPPNGYIRVTDVATGAINSNWPATAAGRYLAVIDTELITTDHHNYSFWDTAYDRNNDVLNTWKSTELSPMDVRRRFGIDVAVGPGTIGIPGYAPWIDFWELGTGQTISLYGSQRKSTNFQICLLGLNPNPSVNITANVTLSDVVGPN